MIFLKINGKKYKCKSTLEISITKFSELSKKLSTQKTAKGITYILLDELSTIPKDILNFISEESLLSIDVNDTLTSKELENNINFNDFAFGKVIYIEQFLINGDQQKATARILLDNEIELKDLNEYRQIKTVEAINYLGFYNKWKLELFKNYPNIVSTSQYEKEEGKENKNTWIDLLSQLCNSALDQDKVSRMRFTEILFYLNGKHENSKTD
jgi:hypothetical protein